MTVNQNQYQPAPKKPDRVKAALILLALLLAAGLAVALLRPKKEADREPLTVESGVSVTDGEETEADKEEDYTEIPVFRSLTVNADSPNLYLGNPEINHVYFRYKVTLKNEDGSLGKVLYDNDAVVEPGRAFQVNAYEQLEPGAYKLAIDISTFDMETEVPCNGATQEADLVVE